MPKICLQAGHENVKHNSLVSLRGSTGALGEMAFNVEIRNRVAEELRKRGFEVTTTDANANDDKTITTKDFDLFLSIHYDADVYGVGGGFSDYPEPSTDGATAQSQRICSVINQVYFSETGIAYFPNRSNKNTRYYYMWKYLTAKTPCVLLECGVGQHKPDDYEILQNNRNKVVECLSKAICRAFDVAYDNSQEEVEKLNTKYDLLLKEKKQLEEEYSQIKIVAEANKIDAEKWRATTKAYDIDSVEALTSKISMLTSESCKESLKKLEQQYKLKMSLRETSFAEQLQEFKKQFVDAYQLTNHELVLLFLGVKNINFSQNKNL